MLDVKKIFKRFGIILKKNDMKNNPKGGESAISPDTEKVDSALLDACMSGWFRNDTGELIEGFKIRPEDIVIDVGCGDSLFLDFCARQCADIICVDIDAQKVSSIAKRLEGSPARSVRAFVSDACPLPVEDASVTKIIAMEVLEHVDDPCGFLKELARVGKPGAQYLITVPDPVAETVQKDIAPAVYFTKPNHIRIIGRKEFEQMVMDAGLVVEQRKYYGFYRAIWWMFFWACKQEPAPPWHPLLESWTQTWNLLLETEDGPRIKRAMDDFMPKSQAIIAKKPF